MPHAITQFRLAVRLIVLSCLCVSAVAQDNDPSHRKLKLPSGSNGNAQQQIQLIKQLQALMQNRSEPAGESKGLSDAQKSLMESMLEQFKDNEDLPKLSDIPPDLLSKVLADPKAREDAAKMLKKFQKDRQLPNGNGQGKLPLPPGNRQGKASGSQSQNSANPKPGSNRQPETDPVDRANGNQTPSTPFDPQSNSNQRSPRTETRPSPDNGTAGNQRRPSAQERLPTQRPNESSSDYEERVMDFIDRKIRDQQSTGQTERLGPSELPEIPPAIPNRPGTRPPNVTGDSRATEPSGNGSPAAGDGRDTGTSLSDLLKNLDGLPPVTADQLKEFQQRSGTKQPEQTQQRQQQKREQQQAKDAEELREVREQARRDLDRGGLGSVLKKIFEESKSQAKKRTAPKANRVDAPATGGTGTPAGNRDAGSGMSEGMQDAIIRSLDGLGKDLLEIAKDAKVSQRKPKSNRRPGNDPVANDSSAAAPKPPRTDSWAKQATDIISDITKPPETKPATPDTAASPGATDAAGTSISATPFLALGAIALVVLLLAWRTGAISPQAILNRSNQTLEPQGKLRSRKDVVKAFHRFTRLSRRDIQSWWTHQQVEELVKQQEPANREPIEVLASVYEQARYLPDDDVLAEDQLHAAQTALDRCSS